MPLTYRAIKGAPLTHAEQDDNIATLDASKLNASAATPVTDTLTAADAADEFLVFDVSAAGVPKRITKANLLAGLGTGSSYWVGATAPDPVTFPLWFNTTDGVFLVYVTGAWVEPGASYMPPGGTTGQALVKASDDDHDYVWGPAAPSPVISWMI